MKANIASIIGIFPFILLTGVLLTSNSKMSAQHLTNIDTLYVTSGTVLYMGGNFTNDAGAIAENNGIMQLDGDWTNNGIYLPDTGEVKLSGASQSITGSTATTFYDLTLQGTGIKTLTIDATVTDLLALNNLEMATNTNTLFITTADTSAITRTNGFVSSLGAGSLSRMTDMPAPYLFPVGSSIGSPRYRPVEITPATVTPHGFTVRMANVDATTEGFDRTVKDSTVSSINPDFYHRINRTTGTDPADIAIHFDNTVDSGYQAMSHWQNLPQWESTGVVNLINNVSPTLSSLTKSAWNDFANTPFALSFEPGPVTLTGSDTTICAGDSVTFTATNGFVNYEFFINGTTAQNGSDSIYISDTLSNTDTVIVVSTDSLGGKSLSDTIFIIVNPVYNTPVAASICSGDSLQLPLGLWVDSAGIYNDTLTTISGCDSVITTTVTVDSVYNTLSAAAVCQGDSIQLPGGTYATSAGTYNDTLTTISGCDSVITTTVTVDS
ncbi:MAG: hypothetical protein JKX73_03245, partial [Flavobacteriales bacterium]|nr:hypothetical protein [Flavobacteriales bacterium]